MASSRNWTSHMPSFKHPYMIWTLQFVCYVFHSPKSRLFVLAFWSISYPDKHHPGGSYFAGSSAVWSVWCRWWRKIQQGGVPYLLEKESPSDSTLLTLFRRSAHIRRWRNDTRPDCIITRHAYVHFSCFWSSLIWFLECNLNLCVLSL